MLRLGDFDNFPPFVLAAMRANPVRKLGFVAIGALGKRNFFQAIVGAPVTSPRGRMSSLWIWH